MGLEEQMDGLAYVVGVAKEAGKAIVAYDSKDIATVLKQDKSLVTPADKESERLIMNGLRKRFPDDRFIGEEGGITGNDGAEYSWYVDPLDGTGNFVKQRGPWAVVVARGGRHLELGVIYFPNEHVLITAERDKGVRMNGEPSEPVETTPLSECVVLYDTHGGKKEKEALRDLDQYKGKVKATEESTCSADAYRRLLTGKADVYLNYVSTPWDDAAGVLAVRELGGRATGFSGSAWTPALVEAEHGNIEGSGRRMTLQTKTVLATRNPTAHGEMLRLVRH